MQDAIDQVEEIVERAKGAMERYDPAIKQGLAAVDDARKILEAWRDGDHEKVQAQLTRWRDVNETWAAVRDMDRAIEDATSGPEIEDVLGVVLKSLQVAITVVSLA